MPKGIRKKVTIPGILGPVVTQRYAEFDYRAFSPFALELVCYDLRTCAKHTITLEVAADTQAAQDAVDRELVAYYQPGRPREGFLVRVVDRIYHLQETACKYRNAERLPSMCVVPERITFPAILLPLINQRWRELGYSTLSAYVTGLVRYDLMIGGPHLFTASDSVPEIQEALTRETVEAFHKGQERKLSWFNFFIHR